MDQGRMHKLRISHYGMIIAVLWTLLIVYSLFWEHRQHREEARLIGRMQGQAFFEKDLLYRRWASRHGGVYVPVTESTQPNPHLSHIPDRDIATPAGKQLTLMNPAYMTRQVFEMAQEYKGTGRGHITSLKPIRPANAPDPWEKKALLAFERGATEIGEIEQIDGTPYYRYMKSLIADKSCLKCHAAQGYREGDVRGGLSVSVPLESVYAMMNKEMQGVYVNHAFIWVLGLGMIGFGARRLDRMTTSLLEKTTELEQEIEGRQTIQESLQEQAVMLEEEIAERKQAEAALTASEDQLRLILDSTAGAIYGIDLQGRCTFSNSACLKMLGYSRQDELLGRDMHGLAHHSYPDGTPFPVKECRIYQAFTRGEGTHVDDEVLWRADGTCFPAEYWSYPQFRAGKVVGAVVAFLDITERKQSEKEREQFFKFFVSSDELMVIADPNGCFVRINPACTKVLGYSETDLLSKPFIEFVHPDDRQATLDEMSRQMHCGYSLNFENRYLCKDGSLRHLSWRAIYTADERITYATARDITDQKRVEAEHRIMEEQLRQAQKMEAIGQLAGGVAHDFNNILTVIMGNCNLLQMDPKLGPHQREEVEQILASSEKATHLTRGLLTFSRKEVMELKMANLNNIVQHVQKFLLRVIGEDIQLKTMCSDTPIPVKVDAAQIEQVLINLATNARDAMQHGGLLSIETGIQDIDDAFVHTHGYSTPGRYACMTVSDSGCGMDEQTCERIFEPFFTTKEAGKGTGLGMAIIYGIVKQHNGFVNVYSEPGHGTTFRIYLPLFNQEQVPQEEDIAPVAPRGGTETVLVAEDDAGVSTLMESILKKHGYQVILARDGQDAIEKFTANRDVIQLVLMDMIMPRKNGQEALQEIRQLRPGIQAFYLSGYTADFIQSRGMDEGGIELIMKPVRPLELLRKVRDMLDRQGGRDVPGAQV